MAFQFSNKKKTLWLPRTVFTFSYLFGQKIYIGRAITSTIYRPKPLQSAARAHSYHFGWRGKQDWPTARNCASR